MPLAAPAMAPPRAIVTPCSGTDGGDGEGSGGGGKGSGGGGEGGGGATTSGTMAVPTVTLAADSTLTPRLAEMVARGPVNDVRPREEHKTPNDFMNLTTFEAQACSIPPRWWWMVGCGWWWSGVAASSREGPFPSH